MNIAVCGVNSYELLNKVENHYNVKCVDVVGSPNESLNMYKLSKVTYEYDNVINVVFNGCVLDCVENNMHPLDEQILLCGLENLDVVYLYTPHMSAEEINKYHRYDEFFKGKVIDVVDLDTFTI